MWKDFWELINMGSKRTLSLELGNVGTTMANVRKSIVFLAASSDRAKYAEKNQDRSLFQSSTRED